LQPPLCYQHKGGFLFLFSFYYSPNNFPAFARLPLLVVGMPVAFATFFFAFVIPRALFALKESPGIADFFFAM